MYLAILLTLLPLSNSALIDLSSGNFSICVHRKDSSDQGELEGGRTVLGIESTFKYSWNRFSPANSFEEHRGFDTVYITFFVCY